MAGAQHGFYWVISVCDRLLRGASSDKAERAAVQFERLHAWTQEGEFPSLDDVRVPVRRRGSRTMSNR